MTDLSEGVASVANDGSHVFPRYQVKLAAAKPFLMPSFDNRIVEILPSEKQNRKIRFDEEILVQEIENRFAYANMDEEDDDDSYEIEIVEDDGDADFYLEIVDGEVFYVFETEDDISDDESDEEDADMQVSESETETDLDDSQPRLPLQLPIAAMSAPNLDADMETIMPTYEKRQAVVTPAPARDPVLVLSDDEESPPVSPMAPAPVAPAAVVAMSMAASSSAIEFESGLVTPVHSAPSTPDAPKKLSVKDMFFEDIPTPTSPIATHIAPASPGSGIRTPVRSILKACPESPRRPVTPKKKKDKKEKKEKTFTKTYVRAEHYDGEHVAYSWEKPDWTKTQLRSTGKGDEVRKGGNLANPITFPKNQVVNAQLEEEEFEQVNKEELIRRLKGGDSAIALHPLPGYRGKQRKLKFSINGAKIRDGGDIVKPITKATVYRKPEDVNLVAKPDNLKHTDAGDKVKKGINLAAPVTQATVIRTPEDVNHVANKTVLKNKGVEQEKKTYQWEKPAWTRPKLNSSGNRSFDEDTINDEGVARGSELEAKKKYQWEKPAWAKKDVLRQTDKGDVVRQGETLAKPITELPDLARRVSEQQ